MLPLIAMVLSWLPLVSHNYIVSDPVDWKSLEYDRHFPSDDELNEIHFLYEPELSSDELVSIAQKILNGKIDIPGLPQRTISLPFDKNDVVNGPGNWQLALASFHIPFILCSAYEETGEKIYLTSARDNIVGWAEFDKKLWLPKGFIWNDHAISARISVIVKFWKLYRMHPLFDRTIAKKIFSFLIRDAKRLSNPTHFTFSSNHGIMQNIGLLQISFAFPKLKNNELFRTTGIERLNKQLEFYINSEGVVLEHSPGYHRDGILLLSQAFRILTKLNHPIPNRWKDKYEKALTVYSQLVRPDGSLPMIGDTGSGKTGIDMQICQFDDNNRCIALVNRSDWAPSLDPSLYPVAGLASWWTSSPGKKIDYTDLSQTVITWANFMGHAHKHADELSLTLWDDGNDWWTNIGYYPYGKKFRANAISWEGSNAPHLIGESKDSERAVELNSYYNSKDLDFIDLTRKGVVNNLIVNRQVFQIKEKKIWGVLDFYRFDQGETVRTIWTSIPEINIIHNKEMNCFTLNKPDKDIILQKHIRFSEGGKVNVYRGSVDPFAGWVIEKTAPAITIEHSNKKSWALVVWKINKKGSFDNDKQVKNNPVIAEVQDNNKWKIEIYLGKDPLVLERENENLHLSMNKIINSEKLIIINSDLPKNKISVEKEKIESVFDKLSQNYPKFQTNFKKRLKATVFVIIILLGQEFLLVLVKKKNSQYLSISFPLIWIPVFYYIIKIY